MGIFVPKINHLAMIEVSYKCNAINFFFFQNYLERGDAESNCLSFMVQIIYWCVCVCVCVCVRVGEGLVVFILPQEFNT